MVLDLALLGTGGMMPLPERWLSSVLMRLGSRLLLFDCGEGTQIPLRAMGWGIKAIDLILISHVHGDHVTGLPGLLLSLGNSGRTEPVQILGPPGFEAIVRGLLVVAPRLPFAVQCRTLQSLESVRMEDLTVVCAAAEHSVPCLAYRLDVPRSRPFLPDRASALGVPMPEWGLLQRGESVGNVTPDQVLGPPRRGISVGLVTDTRPTLDIEQLIIDVDLLVCEGTYGDDADQPRAVERTHMTFREAAGLAARAGAKRLLLTHFSPSVVNPQQYAANALEVFAETIVGRDRLTMTLAFPPA